MRMSDLITESDNATVDHVKILALLSVIVGLALQIWVVVRWVGPAPQPFDFFSFGTGIGALFGGVGVALKLKPESSHD